MKNMITKDELRKKFSEKYKEIYEVKFFQEKGFIRKQCPKCGRFFWTLDPDRKYCGEPPCESYSFIGNPPTKKKYDYIEMWRVFADFFKRKGHTEIKRYPVVARWRDDLYFTIASISDFQPYVVRGEVDPPANPLVVPQVCLRFSDIPNVGITGRHLTSFIMGGQHAFNTKEKTVYWKSECLEMNFEFLTKDLGIPENEIVAKEDVWMGGGNFGPSIEYHIRGLEVVNQVFMQFEETPDGGYRELETRVIDVGWGHNRLVWISRGDPTAYDGVFGPVMKKMIENANIEIDYELYSRYATLAGLLNVDEVRDINQMWKRIAQELNVSINELMSTVKPMQALYAIADHVRTLVFAITDGAIPSNVGGGYNLRVILRRALSFIDAHKFNFDLTDVAYWHIQYLKKLFPELEPAYDNIVKILDVEKNRFKQTIQRGSNIVMKLIKGRKEDVIKLSAKEMARLYDTHGITPEIIDEIAKKNNVRIEIPPDFYTELTKDKEKIKKEEKEEKIKIDLRLLEGLPPTEQLYYQDEYRKEFDACVLKIIGDRYVVLDKTCFYPEGGGQPADIGILGNSRVVDTQKIGQYIIHIVDRVSFKVGDLVHGEIDWKRRVQLMRQHTATHAIIESARRLLGNHVWQWGSQLHPDISRLDITHYQALTDDDVRTIERMANQVVLDNRRVIKKFMSRRIAEDKYGFRLYQGGVVPGKIIRVVEVENWDVEACGGTHLDSTSEIGLIRLIRTKRIQDGVVRIEYATGESAIRVTQEENKLLHESASILKVEPHQLPKTVERFFEEWKAQRKLIDKLKLKLAEYMVSDLETKREKIKDYFMILEEIKTSDIKELISLVTNATKRQIADIIIVYSQINNTMRFVIGYSQKKISKTAGEQMIKEFFKRIHGGGGRITENVYQGGSKSTLTKDEIKAVIEAII